MPLDLVAILQRERRAQLARRVSPYVFADEQGDHYRNGWLNRQAAHIARAAGVRPINPNGYRHSFASMLVHGGMALTLVAKLLGHVDLAMLSKTYGHPMVDVPDTTPFLGTLATVA